MKATNDAALLQNPVPTSMDPASFDPSPSYSAAAPLDLDSSGHARGGHGIFGEPMVSVGFCGLMKWFFEPMVSVGFCGLMKWFIEPMVSVGFCGLMKWFFEPMVSVGFCGLMKWFFEPMVSVGFCGLMKWFFEPMVSVGLCGLMKWFFNQNHMARKSSFFLHIDEITDRLALKNNIYLLRKHVLQIADFF